MTGLRLLEWGLFFGLGWLGASIVCAFRHARLEEHGRRLRRQYRGLLRENVALRTQLHAAGLREVVRG